MNTKHISSEQAFACGAVCGMAWSMASRHRDYRVKPVVSASVSIGLAGIPRHAGGAANGLFATAT